MTNYKLILEDLQGLKALERVRKTNDIGEHEKHYIVQARGLLYKDLILNGGTLGNKVYNALYMTNINEYENQINFHIKLVELAERGRLDVLWDCNKGNRKDFTYRSYSNNRYDVDICNDVERW